MKKKILFFDVDSTLYSHKSNSIPKSAIEAIKIAKANGHIIVLATGRSKKLTDLLDIFKYIQYKKFYENKLKMRSRLCIIVIV